MFTGSRCWDLSREVSRAARRPSLGGTVNSCWPAADFDRQVGEVLHGVLTRRRLTDWFANYV